MPCSSMQEFYAKDVLATLNYGDKKQLMKLHTIGAKTADKILACRAASLFQEVGDLARIGLSDKKLLKFIQENIQNRVAMYSRE